MIVESYQPYKIIQKIHPNVNETYRQENHIDDTLQNGTTEATCINDWHGIS